MKMNLMHYDNFSILENTTDEILLTGEEDALELIGLCGEKATRTILLTEKNLSESFFDLKSRIAGDILQKFTNYFVRFLLVLPEHRISGRFGEMVLEANKSSQFRVFHTKEEAILWLKKIDH